MGILSLTDVLLLRSIPMAMTGVYHWLRARVFPPVPESIRDDVALLRANRVETLTPMLFLTLAATTPTAIYAGVESVHWIVRLGFPITLAVVCLLGFLYLLKARGLGLLTDEIDV